MPDNRVYSYKILQDADLSQNDLLNVRKINNDDYNVLIDSKNHVQIESVEPGSTNDAFVKVSPRTVDAKTTEGTGANESSSEVILEPGKIDVSSTTDIDVSTPELDIDASSKVTVDTLEVINTVGSHYKTSVGDKSIEITESNDSFILSHGDSSKVEINNGSIVETTPVAEIKSSDNITLDTPNFNIKDGDTPLVNIEKLSTNHGASVTLPLEDSFLNLDIDGQIVTISESTDYEGNQASYQIEDLIEKIEDEKSRIISGNFSVSVKSVSANEDDEQEPSYDERPDNTFTIQSESGSEPGVRIEASETRITSTDSQLKGSGYSPNVLSVNNNDITLYTDESNGYIKLEQSIKNNAYKNSIKIKADDVDIKSPGDIALESDTSAKIKSGDNYMEVTPSTGTIHIDDGTLGIKAKESITSVSGKTQIKQTSDVDGITDLDKIEIFVKKGTTFNSSILLDKDKILEDSKNITLNSDTGTEVKSNNTVYLSSKNGGNSTYDSNGVATTGNIISNAAGNSSETITSSGSNAGISRVSDSKDSSKVESGDDISEIEVLPASETLKVKGTNESSQIGLEKDNISLSSCKNVIAEVTENSVSGTKGHIEIKKDSNKVKIESQANEVSLYSMSSNVLNNQNKLSLGDNGAVISIPNGSLGMTSNTKISSEVGHLGISLEKNSQGESITESITASASEDGKISEVILDKDSISSQSDVITSVSDTSTNIRSKSALTIGKGSSNDNYSASSKYYSDGVIETIGTTISNTAGTGNEQSSETISKSEGISRSSNVKDHSEVGNSIMNIDPNSETFISETIEMKVDSSVNPAGYIKLEKNNSGKSKSTIVSDTTEFTSSSKISSKVNNNLEVSLIEEDSSNYNKDSITILAKGTNNNSKITLDNENIKSEGQNITSKSVSSTEVKSEGNLTIGKGTDSSYSVSSTYDSNGITNSAPSLTISNSAANINSTAANINSTADTLVDIKVKGSGDNDDPNNEIKIGNDSRGIELSSNDTISSESKNVEIKLKEVIENSNNHNASIKLNTSSNKTEAKISATDGVLIEAPAAGNSKTNSDIKLDAGKDIKLDADEDIELSAENDAILSGTNVTISSGISSGKTTISGNELDVASTTTKIEGNSTTISSSASTNITSNKTDITSGTIDIGDSTNPGTINIVGNNNLSIKTGLSKSEVQSDNLKFNETLSSNNIKIYWDSTNNALVFSKV